MRNLHWVVFYLGLVTMVTCWDVPDNIKDTYFGEIKREHEYGEIEIKGIIPDWLSGYFIHQTCGSFGNQSNPVEGAKLTHTFDGIGAVASFKLNGGTVQYSIKYYVTQSFKVFDYYSRDMDQSKVAWGTIFSPLDVDQFDKWQQNFSDYPNDNPNVAFWKIGDNVEAMSEAIAGVWIDLDNLETKGTYPFKDDNLGLPPYMINLNNPAHEHYDEDGVTVYGSAVMYDLSVPNSMNATRMVYKIEDDERIPIASFQEAGPLDLDKCSSGSSYPEMDDRGGYMHSFCMTQNHFIIPVSTYHSDVCSIFRSEPSTPPGPFFKDNYEFSKTTPTRFVIISRSTNEVVGEFSTPDGLFITHQLNSYEEDGFMYLDMLTYHSNVYWHMYMDELLGGPVSGLQDNTRTQVERFKIDMSDWTLEERIDLFPTRDEEVVEFSTVNYDLYNGKPYQYSYMVGLDPIPNSLIKLDVKSKTAVYWGPYDGLIPGEPIFVPSPDAVDEDDGVIIANVLDANVGKGMIVVLDGKTFKELGRALSPEGMPFGLHSKFIPRKFDPLTSASIQTVANFVTCVVMAILSIFVRL
ncbi:beta,beta-carotene 15,15'-dioxygenase-like [Glandiceps talaboti]